MSFQKRKKGIVCAGYFPSLYEALPAIEVLIDSKTAIALIDSGGSRTLIDKKFIIANKSKRTYILETTPLFSDYFGLSRDKKVLKRQLLRWIEHRISEQDTKTKNVDQRTID